MALILVERVNVNSFRGSFNCLSLSVATRHVSMVVCTKKASDLNTLTHLAK